MCHKWQEGLLIPSFNPFKEIPAIVGLRGCLRLFRLRAGICVDLRMWLRGLCFKTFLGVHADHEIFICVSSLAADTACKYDKDFAFHSPSAALAS